MQVVQHLHLQRVIAHRNVTVSGITKLMPTRCRHAHPCWPQPSQTPAASAQTPAPADCAQHLVDIPDLNCARRRCLLRSAALQLAPPGFGLAHIVATRADFIPQSTVQQLLPNRCEIRIASLPAKRMSNRRASPKDGVSISSKYCCSGRPHDWPPRPPTPPHAACPGPQSAQRLQKTVVPTKAGGRTKLRMEKASISRS